MTDTPRDALSQASAAAPVAQEAGCAACVTCGQPWQEAVSERTAEPTAVGFSRMELAPIDGTAVLLHMPTTTDKFAIGQWHGNGTTLEGNWGDDEGNYYVHQPVGWMSLSVLDRIANGLAAPATEPTACDWPVCAVHHPCTKACKRDAASAKPDPDANPSAPWLTEAHMLCTDQGIAQGHIQYRLLGLRAKLAEASAKPAPHPPWCSGGCCNPAATPQKEGEPR